MKSYRVFKHDSWVGKPDTVPDVKVEGRKVYVSWNGATEVRGWRLETARTQDTGDDGFVTVQELRKDGFETSFSIEGVDKFIRIAALDSGNGVMARSVVIHVKPRHMVRRLGVLCLLLLVTTNRIHSLCSGLFRLSRFASSASASSTAKSPTRFVPG